MEIDVLSLVIFAASIVLFIWDKLPMATTAILGCVAMVILGVCDFKTAFAPFSSSTVVLTIGVMMTGAAIAETGLAANIGAWIVRRARGSETKLIVGTYLVSSLMSAFLTNSAVLAIFIPIVMGLAAANPDINARNLIMPIAYGCVLGGAATLVGSTQQMTAQGLLEEAGVRLFKTFDFTPVGGLLVLLGLIYCLTIGRTLGNRIWGGRAEDSDYKVTQQQAECKKDKMIIVTIIFLATVILYITELIPIAATSTSAALACIITGCITQKKAISAVNWNIVGRLGGCLGLAKGLEAAGGTDLIADLFHRIVGDSMSPFVLFVVLVLFVNVISEFMSNSTAILIVLPIVLAIAPQMNLNAYAFALGITLTSGVALSCPLSSSTLGMSMSVGYRFNDYFKYSIAFDIVSFFVIIVSVPLIYGLTV